MLAQDPDDKHLLLGRVAALQDGPDGKAYEQAAREAIRWFPRFPSGYVELAHWYSMQHRQDLADAVFDEARKALPDVFESSTDSGTAEDQPPSADTEQPLDKPLPEDKNELLNLVWQPHDARRETALARAVELDQAGHLHWYESARLLACQLLIPTELAGQPAATPESLLPAHPPGAAHWFADTLCDILTDGEPEIGVATAVNRWLDQVVANVRNYPELWFKRVLLLEHARQLERALDELRQLLEHYPAVSSALYRMGVVKYRQQDYQGARTYLEKALEVNPGLVGAMQVLRSISQTLDDPDEELRCTQMLRRKLPYYFDYYRDEVLTLADRESAPAAELALNAAAAYFPEKQTTILRGRLFLAAGERERAATVLSQVELSDDDDDDAFDACLQAKIDVAMAQDPDQILELCDAGLRRWPTSTRLRELQAEQLAERDPSRCRQLLLDVLCQGDPGAQTAWQYLTVVDRPLDAACEAVMTTPEDRRLALAELFARVMSHHRLVKWNQRFLEWALKEFPDSDALRWRLASHYNINGDADAAIMLAEQLYDRNPDTPEAARMLGRCLIDRNADRALGYLEKVCEQDRSIDNLFDLARCHQIVGNTSRSQELHWEILQQNPYAAASWTNLLIFGAARTRLWPYLEPMLDAGYGLDDEYFYVAAVKIALQVRKRLPPPWFPLAVKRWAMLQTYPGFLDERVRLRRALLAWKSVRPRDVDQSMQLPRDFTEAVLARFWWPGQRWIPRA